MECENKYIVLVPYRCKRWTWFYVTEVKRNGEIMVCENEEKARRFSLKTADEIAHKIFNLVGGRAHIVLDEGERGND